MYYRCLCRMLLAAACLAGTPALQAGGVLEDVRDAVEENDHRDGDGSESNGWSRDCDSEFDDDDDESENELGNMLARPLGLALSIPWWGPRIALDDSFSSQADFPAAPYAQGAPGHLLITSTMPTLSRRWAGRGSWHYGTDFGGLQWSTARFQVDSAARFGFDAEWTRWVESSGRRDDSLSIGDVNLLHRFAQSEQVEFHTGIGVNWLADGSDGEAGINLTYGVQAFPIRPWTLQASIDAGTLGDAGLFHLRIGGGAVWHHCELFTGYDIYRIGDVTLDGAFAGAALWF